MEIYKVRDLESFRNFEVLTKDEYVKHLQFLESIKPEKNEEFYFRGNSYTAGKVVDFVCDFNYSSGFPDVNWRERVVCPYTELNNRMRAAVHMVDHMFDSLWDDKVYIMEQTTAVYRFLKKKYRNLIGSEFLGTSRPLGSTTFRGIRNEDATRLTFADNSLAAILSFDVFEHVFDYKAAFKECYRTLKPVVVNKDVASSHAASNSASA